MCNFLFCCKNKPSFVSLHKQCGHTKVTVKKMFFPFIPVTYHMTSSGIYLTFRSSPQWSNCGQQINNRTLPWSFLKQPYYITQGVTPLPWITIRVNHSNFVEVICQTLLTYLNNHTYPIYLFPLQKLATVSLVNQIVPLNSTYVSPSSANNSPDSHRQKLLG